MTSQSVTYKIAQPYAEALLSAAKDLNIVDQNQVEILFLSNLLSESTELKNFLDNPLIISSLKKDLLKELFTDHLSDCLLKFLLVLVDRRRISLLGPVIEKYLELAYELESTTVVEISTAIVLTESQQDALVEKLKIMTNSKNIKLLLSIDTSLIGGFVAKVGSKIIDTSISGKLRNMAFYLSSV
uniref:ATP synthase CF1 delta subunit n=2 Tax=Gelidium TaxID=2811 RepID=A0A411FSM9_9FLOR|nr:ATP synthase CF1 delta subunit [Gelidium coulteri]YP_009565221.1 ATP synthase CF1 delta subunit [Gelidium sinicola]QBA96172.1 ATP synthase CF1 delta subunit [Gelidium coulteri]QBA96572.1 ATP synthase CF1 delta subunit [Gelidium sinicola]